MMRDYPHVPARVKVAVLPYVILVAVGLLVADDWGLIDLAAASQTPAPTRPAPAAPPSRAARTDIPPRYLRLYRDAARPGVPWQVLAAIGSIESDHGRSRAPGVRSGVNRFGCCAGPMQFNLRNGPPSTWDRWGRGDVYRPEDAIPAAARYLTGHGARANLDRAIYAYNHSWQYVANVKRLAARYSRGDLHKW